MSKHPHPLGPRPELKWIPITQLVVDGSYQRATTTGASKKNIAHIREGFTWAHCGALIVCQQQDKKTYAVLDGQHRLQAATERGDITEMPCVVVQEWAMANDAQKQASDFVAINSHRVAMQPLARYHAAIVAGDARAKALAEILKTAQVELPRVAPQGGLTSPRQTVAVGTLLTLAGTHNPEHIVFALTAIAEAYPQKNGMMRAQLIKALVDMVKNTPDIDRPRLIRILRDKINPIELENEARSYVAISGGSTTTAARTAIERKYKNAGRIVGTEPASPHPIHPSPNHYCRKVSAHEDKIAPPKMNFFDENVNIRD